MNAESASISIAVSSAFDLLDLHRLNPSRYPHLLQSASIGPQGRYDVLFACPGKTLRSDDAGIDVFLDALEHWYEQEKISVCSDSINSGKIPFSGGWFLYLSYELAAEIEPTLALPDYNGKLPVALATRFPAAVIHDRETNARFAVAENTACLQKIEKDIAVLPAASVKTADNFPVDSIPVVSITEEPDQDYTDAVRCIIDYIIEGDVFQVNLSRKWSASLTQELDHHALYAKLRVANPGPFNGMATWGESAIFSSSPERLVSMQGDLVQTRPIAGTRPRGEQTQEDVELSEELLAHPKEMAEHIMLVDLERNDMGRFAVPGTVEVDELMVLESYATVHHIVSNIRATKRPEITPIDVIKAVFPGGTITGCPKVRCMEIIAELEKTGRGPYTGSMGYLDRCGNLDLNILIRTIVRDGSQLHFRAGAGIVADSDPQRELDESRAKANGMLATLGVASK